MKSVQKSRKKNIKRKEILIVLNQNIIVFYPVSHGKKLGKIQKSEIYIYVRYVRLKGGMMEKGNMIRSR